MGTLGHSSIRLTVAVIVLAGQAAGAADGDEPGLPDEALHPFHPRIWEEGIGAAYREDVLEAGFAVGAGPGLEVIGSTEEHDLAQLSGRFGWVFAGPIGAGMLLGGRPELLWEAFWTEQFQPEVRAGIGGSVGIRWNFLSRSRWVPYIDWQMGMGWTDIGEPDLTGKFQFNLRPGIGSHFFLRDDLALTLEARWFHMSNAGLHAPNHGTNTLLFMVGFGWFF